MLAKDIVPMLREILTTKAHSRGPRAVPFCVRIGVINRDGNSLVGWSSHCVVGEVFRMGLVDDRKDGRGNRG